MKQKNLQIHYDTEADILEIVIGEPTPCIFDEVDDDLFEARDEKTNELKGYKIFNFMKRASLKNIEVPLPVSIA